MLDLDIRSEARALLQYAEVDGMDPEPAAALWLNATMAEAMSVVHEAKRIQPAIEGSEWYGDFLAAHKWMRRNPEHPETRALVARMTGPVQF